jgi:hypothetical protein
MPVAAVIGAAAIGGVTSVISGNKAAGAAKDAAQMSADVQRYMFDQTRNDYAPWRQVGQNALAKLAKLYGVEASTLMPSYQQPSGVAGQYGVMDGDGFALNYQRNWRDGTGVMGNYGLPTEQPTQAQATNDNDPFADFYASPDYKFRLAEGMKAIERSAAARGGLRSGATMKSIGNYAQGVAAGEYGNYVNRLSALAGIGQQATDSTAAAGQNYANAASNAYTNAGNARASAYANTGNAINQGVSNIASAYLYNKGWGG